MTSYKTFLLVQVFGLLFINTVFANPCPKPKVNIMVEINEDSLHMLQDDYGFKTEQG